MSWFELPFILSEWPDHRYKLRILDNDTIKRDFKKTNFLGLGVTPYVLHGVASTRKPTAVKHEQRLFCKIKQDVNTPSPSNNTL